mmetsp:Transcript_113725/g.226341  ORF Transcript_113725/g.226341 Transcript_113725/m.226341 type:complete len:144 (+) Transcript_113725:46-477(+)
MADLSSELSSTGSKSEDLANLQETWGLDAKHARILLRAQRLEEKGQLDLALTYFKAVLGPYPECQEAIESMDMITCHQETKPEKKQLSTAPTRTRKGAASFGVNLQMVKPCPGQFGSFGALLDLCNYFGADYSRYFEEDDGAH